MSSPPMKVQNVVLPGKSEMDDGGMAPRRMRMRSRRQCPVDGQFSCSLRMSR